jgi:hypothetical protein
LADVGRETPNFLGVEGGCMGEYSVGVKRGD